ncbi:unnamed protein product [Camellia sinensis]
MMPLGLWPSTVPLGDRLDSARHQGNQSNAHGSQVIARSSIQHGPMEGNPLVVCVNIVWLCDKYCLVVLVSTRVRNIEGSTTASPVKDSRDSALTISETAWPA